MKQLATEFIEENLKTIFAYSLSRVSNKEDAEDLTNDIALAILQSADKIKTPEAFYGYIWAIAANTYKKFMRRRSRNQFDELDDEIPQESDFIDDLIRTEDAMILRREISLLSGEYRKCTVAYYYDNLGCQEVADKLGISLEMVKYYLFKTRKILKEGISMERDFGEKSFNPAPFRFEALFSGNYNKEYYNLFQRKLPGQILLSAYYTPMTVRELAIELGVASVYLEEEIALLEKYGLIEYAKNGKFQTKLTIFTEEFYNEYFKTADKLVIPAVADILKSAKGKLEKIRAAAGYIKHLTDTQILWIITWIMIRNGRNQFTQNHSQYDRKYNELYKDTTGICYGISCDNLPKEYDFIGFAETNYPNDIFRTSFIDLALLGEKRSVGENFPSVMKHVSDVINQKVEPSVMVLSEAQENELIGIIGSEISAMADLVGKLFECAVNIMRTHAPKTIADEVEVIIYQLLPTLTFGFIGGCAVKSGELLMPDFEGPAAFYAVKNN